MPLLAEYAITPDVFDMTSYATASECEARLENIREAMLTEGLVRDLRDGEWGALFRSDRSDDRRSNGRPWHPRGIELVKKLAKHGRLIRAIATHAAQPFTGGIIVTKSVKDEHLGEPLVAGIDQLRNADWWVSRSPSVRLNRAREDYERQLDAVLRCSNSLIFIDPHLDPAKPGYRDFAGLLVRGGRRKPAPRIEIHRVCYEGSGAGRQFPMRGDSAYFAHRFRSELEAPLRDADLSAEVFVWDDFHDRYLISNLIGISLSNGFDTRAKQSTIWNRLGRKDRDDVRREFHPAAGSHKLQTRFRIP